MNNKESPKGREKRRIRSIDVGFKVIRVLEKAEGKIPLKMVADSVEMPPSQVYPYLVSFCDAGLVAQDPITGRYGLGPYAIQLGLSVIRQLDVVELARAPMEELRNATGLSVHLSVWSNEGPVIVAKLDGNLSIPMSIRVGHVLPLLAPATGRVFLAYLPQTDTAAILRRETSYGAGLRQRAEEAVEKIRQTGVAFSDSQLYEGFAGMSAPLFNHEGAVVAVMTLLGEARSVDLSLDSAPCKKLLLAAKSISIGLGWQPSDTDNSAASEGD
ncbi:MAG: IclR family transcriptional regulator [Pigmentiphaga sp.]|nr:IclR family transcriptional regulator [Pigmentiphaga sp.]